MSGTTTTLEEVIRGAEEEWPSNRPFSALLRSTAQYLEINFRLAREAVLGILSPPRVVICVVSLVSLRALQRQLASRPVDVKVNTGWLSWKVPNVDELVTTVLQRVHGVARLALQVYAGAVVV
eukprot:RCo042558